MFDPLFSLVAKVAVVVGRGDNLAASIGGVLTARGARSYALDTSQLARSASDGDPPGRTEAELTRLLENEREAHILVHLIQAGHDASEAAWAKSLSREISDVEGIARALVPWLRKGAASAGGAAIVYVLPEFTAAGDDLERSLLRSAVREFARQQAKALGPHGLNVNVILPGLLASETEAPPGEGVLARIPLRRPGDAGDLAAAITMLASRAGGFVSGATLVLDGGMAA